MPPAVLLHPAENAPQATGKPPRQFKTKPSGRPSNRCKGGQRAWLKRLQRAGRTAEAAEWARRCNLHPEPDPAEPATPADAAAGGTGSPTAATAATGAPVPHGAGSAGHGGEGVDQAAGRENGDKTTPSGIILQCSSAAPAAAPADPSLIRGLTGDSLPLIAASPSGEVEGKIGNCQSASISEADGQGVRAEDSVMERGWPRMCEAWVGVRGRNKDWVDVQVTESLWAKAWVRDVVVQYGTREPVRLRWVSADGRDAEYAFMKEFKAREPEEPDPVIEPIGDADLVVEKTDAVLQQSDRDPARESDQQAGPDENPSAGDFMERARMQAFMDYSR